MVIALVGESCTGKSTIAAQLKTQLFAEVWTGKDYLRLAKSEPQAEAAFTALLAERLGTTPHLVWVISEPGHLKLLPEGALRVLVTAELETIKERFASRTGGQLPPPVAAMLERKHGVFDQTPHQLHLHAPSAEDALRQIAALLE